MLVIGGLGFIGVNLTRALAAGNVPVTVLTPARERHEHQAQQLERQGVRIVEGDLRDRGLMAHLVVDQHGIFNLAGQSGAVRSMEDPWTDLDVNCRGNLVLLESVREYAPEAKVVFVGSRLQYGRPDRLPVGEDDSSPALCVHAIHKRAVEEYMHLYGHLFGTRYAIARVTNPYGPGQPRGRTAYGIINRLIHLALAGEVLTVYGDGLQLRDYVHVDDVVRALMRLLEAPESHARVYNVGSGEGTRLIDVAQMITQLAGGRIEHVEWPSLAAQIETGDFVADVSRIRDELGWTPSIALRDGLAQTIAHYRALAA
jgi:nucleoside-diphosphate-sugar epimerase